MLVDAKNVSLRVMIVAEGWMTTYPDEKEREVSIYLRMEGRRVVLALVVLLKTLFFFNYTI